MKRKNQAEQTFDTVRHYPRQPFGKHVGKCCFELRVATNHDGPHVPLSGCTLTEPIDDADKALLVRMGLARFDGAGRFGPDYAALRAHLQGVLRWSDATIAGATWPTILSTLRDHEQPQEAKQGPDLTDDELQVLDILEERDTLTTNETIVRTLAQREIIRSDTTVKSLVRRLLDRGLIERPRQRKGVRLSRAGKACLPEP